jgi:hypothetical protein
MYGSPNISWVYGAIKSYYTKFCGYTLTRQSNKADIQVQNGGHLPDKAKYGKGEDTK